MILYRAGYIKMEPGVRGKRQESTGSHLDAVCQRQARRSPAMVQGRTGFGRLGQRHVGGQGQGGGQGSEDHGQRARGRQGEKETGSGESADIER